MCREIRFNASVNNDDGLLANSYARKYSISFQQARLLLDNDIRHLKSLIESDGEVSIGRLGKLSQSADSLLFTPARSGRSVSRMLGLVDVPSQISKISTSENDEVSEIRGIDSDVRNPHKDYDRYYHLLLNKKAVNIAASLILVCMVTLSMLIPSSNNNREDRASVLPLLEISKSNNTDYAEQPESKISESQTSEKSSLKEESSLKYEQPADYPDSNIVTQPESVGDKRYFLIVATFSNAKEAEKFIGYKAGSSYKLQILPSRTLYRVSAQVSIDKDELVQLLNSPEFKSEFKEAWIWTGKP